MPFNLIVPIASYKSEYAHTLPVAFSEDNEGVMSCIKAILPLDLRLFDGIYFTILQVMDSQYHLSEKLRQQFERLDIKNASVVVLDDLTSSQPETVCQTIRLAQIHGAVFIKDSDCSFRGEVLPQNGVVIYPLESLAWVNPQHKSYVAVDDQFYVTNIIEKRVISHYFLAGGYCFEDAEEYCRYYNRYAGQKGLYLSHIIYSMLLDKCHFRPVLATEYDDFEKPML